MAQDTRLREHPDQRFTGDEHLVDIGATAKKLSAEPFSSGAGGHRQVALGKHGSMTLMLFSFANGGSIPAHTAKGEVTLHVLEGRLDVKTRNNTNELSAGQLLLLNPGASFEVSAKAESQMLMTVCLER